MEFCTDLVVPKAETNWEEMVTEDFSEVDEIILDISKNHQNKYGYTVYSEIREDFKFEENCKSNENYSYNNTDMSVSEIVKGDIQLATNYLGQTPETSDNSEIPNDNTKDYLIFEEMLNLPEFPGAKISYRCYISHINNNVLKKRKRRSKPKKEKVKKETKPLYKCMLCEYSSPRVRSINGHIQSHENDDIFECDQCLYSCDKLNKYMTHKLLHKGNHIFKCKHCSAEFKTSGQLRTHRSQSHIEHKIHVCDQCEYVTDLKKNMNRHILIHSAKMVACKNCSFRCSLPSTLKIHQLIHSAVKPFACDECDYISTRSTDVRKHKLIHLKLKPFFCGKCDYTSRFPSDLIRHRSIHNEERPYRCEFCSFSARNVNSLNRHLHKHSDTRAYVCNVCKTTFKTSSNLHRHYTTFLHQMKREEQSLQIIDINKSTL